MHDASTLRTWYASACSSNDVDTVMISFQIKTYYHKFQITQVVRFEAHTRVVVYRTIIYFFITIFGLMAMIG